MRIATRLIGLSLFWGMLAAAPPVHAGPTYHFSDITFKNAMNAVIGEAQLFMEVVPDVDSAKDRFHFMNTGPLASSLTHVYFTNATLLGLPAILDGTGVHFSTAAGPPALPGGASITPP